MGKSVLDDARELLKSKKFNVKSVYRVYAAGDEGVDCQTILWTTKSNRAATAYVEVDYEPKTGKIKSYTIHSVTGWNVPESVK